MGNFISSDKSKSSTPTCNDITESDLQRKRPRLDPFLYLELYEGGYPYRVLTNLDIHERRNDTINEIHSTIIQLTIKDVRALLRYFKWDKQLLLERYYEYEYNESKLGKLFQEAGIGPVPEISFADEEECEICYMDTARDNIYSLRCGHKFCVQCWKDYLVSKIMTEGTSEITCMGQCTTFIEEDTVKKLVNDLSVVSKYNQYVAKSFVETNRLLRWCISPGCSRAIEAEESLEGKPARCSCGMIFCMQCGVPWHGPLCCDLNKKWKEKSDADSGNSRWLSLHTKPCPKCSAPIEKNGGCNQMTCKKCRYNFCWVCLRRWDNHHDAQAFNCLIGRPKSPKKVTADSYDHFEFYFYRYLSHRNSLNFEKRLYGIIDIRVQELVRGLQTTYTESQFLTDVNRFGVLIDPVIPWGLFSNPGGQENHFSLVDEIFVHVSHDPYSDTFSVDLIKGRAKQMAINSPLKCTGDIYNEAVDVLCSCRQTLMNTYAFAFYLDENTQSLIFSDNLKGLAMSTEALSGYLEQNVRTVNPADMKITVINMGAHCEKRRKIILEHIYEGMEKKWWKYNINY